MKFLKGLLRSVFKTNQPEVVKGNSLESEPSPAEANNIGNTSDPNNSARNGVSESQKNQLALPGTANLSAGNPLCDTTNEVAFKVRLDDIADKEFVAQQKILNQQYSLGGLSPTSTIEDVVDQMTYFADRAQGEHCRAVYEWATEIFGREKMLAQLFRVLSSSSLSVELTAYTFSELEKVHGIEPINLAEWIDTHFHRLPKEDIAKLLKHTGVASFINPETFMKLVVCGQHEKAILLYEAGVRINRKCDDVSISSWHYDNGDTVIATVVHNVAENQKGKHPLQILKEEIKGQYDFEAILAKRKKALHNLFDLHQYSETPNNAFSQAESTTLTQLIFQNNDEDQIIEEFERSLAEDKPDDNRGKNFFIVVKDGPAELIGDEWQVERPENFLGRNSDSEIVFEPLGVSRRHCNIIIKDQLPYLKNLSTTTPTKLNGRKINDGEIVLLKNNDVITIGPVVLTFVTKNCGLAGNPALYN